MASKRALYRPASQENVGNRQKRTPLAQGRLITKPLLRESTSVPAYDSAYETPSALAHDDTSITVAHSPRDGSIGSPRLRLSSHIQAGMADDLYGSPRREAPSSCQSRSPKPARPMRTLDVTDEDEPLSHSRSPMMQHLHGRSPPDVLVVNASRQTKSPDATEVDVVVGYEHSPAKVVCHSPAVVQSDLRNTGSVSQARQVEVDHVPRVSVLTETDYTDPEAPKPPSTFKAPLVVRESAVAGSFVDPDTSSTLVNTSSYLTSHLTRTITESQQHHSYAPLKDTVRNKPPGSTKKTTEKSTRHAEKENKSSNKPVLDASKERRPKKERVGRVVQSRLMTGVSDRTSFLAPKLSGKTQRTTPKPSSRSATSTSQTHKSRSTSQAKKPVKQALSFSATPDVRGGGRVGGTTSTPTGPTVVGQPHLDASAILPEVSMVLPTPSATGPAEHLSVSSSQAKGKVMARTKHGVHTKRAIAEDSTISNNTSTDSVMSVASSVGDSAYASHHRKTPGKSVFTRKKKSENDDVSQLQLDLLYGRYLQAVFLDSKARKSMQNQEKDAMAQLYSLWDDTEKLRRKQTEADLHLARLKHANKLDEQLELQQAGLGPVTANLPKLRQQYGTLSHALDTIRHQLPVRGVHLPDNEDQYQDNLLRALQESEQLLGELSVVVREPQPKVSTFANAINALERAVEAESKELEKCSELLAAAQTLTAQESSLKIQQMQSQEN